MFGNVIINNLVIKNAQNSAIFIKNATLTTNNVTFENNIGGEEGGAIHAEKANYSSVNDKSNTTCPVGKSLATKSFLYSILTFIGIVVSLASNCFVVILSPF